MLFSRMPRMPWIPRPTHPLLDALRMVALRLGKIEDKLIQLGEDMSELDDRQNEALTAVQGEVADVTRVLGDLTQKITDLQGQLAEQGKLTPEQSARFDDIVTSANSARDALDAADPQPPVEPTV